MGEASRDTAQHSVYKTEGGDGLECGCQGNNVYSLVKACSLSCPHAVETNM